MFRDAFQAFLLDFKLSLFRFSLFKCIGRSLLSDFFSYFQVLCHPCVLIMLDRMYHFLLMIICLTLKPYIVSQQEEINITSLFPVAKDLIQKSSGNKVNNISFIRSVARWKGVGGWLEVAEVATISSLNGGGKSGNHLQFRWRWQKWQPSPVYLEVVEVATISNLVRGGRSGNHLQFGWRWQKFQLSPVWSEVAEVATISNLSCKKASVDAFIKLGAISKSHTKGWHWLPSPKSCGKDWA